MAGAGLRLGRRRCRGETVAPHDLRHPRSIRRASARRVDDLGRLTEERRTDRGWRYQTERFRVLLAGVVEPVHGAARDTERLPRSDVDGHPVDGPGQDGGDAVDRLFVMKSWLCAGAARRWAAGATSSKAATLPFESSPVSRKRTASGRPSAGTADRTR